MLKNIGLKGRLIMSLLGSHKCLGPALFFSYKVICLGKMNHKNICRLASGSDKDGKYLKNIDTTSSVNILTAVDFEDHFGQGVSMIYLPLSHYALCVYLIC